MPDRSGLEAAHSRVGSANSVTEVLVVVPQSRANVTGAFYAFRHIFIVKASTLNSLERARIMASAGRDTLDFP